MVCVDEKPVVLHKDKQPSIPMQPGRIGRRDYEYKRCGTANVFCGVEPKAGRHFTKTTPTRSSPEFADFLLEIAEHYPAADTIHLVLDNLSTHTRKALVDRFGEAAGGLAMGRTFHGSLHAQTRKLAESGRDRDQSLQPPMPGHTPNWGHRRTPLPDQSMEPPRQSRQNQNTVEVHPKTSSSHTSLLFHAVTILAGRKPPSFLSRLAGRQ